MIQIIPAIDMIEGKCVRLTKGDFETKKTYFDDPLEVAMRFEDHGIKRLHLVDLDGAKKGQIVNYKQLEKIARRTTLQIDFGGGVRTQKDLEIAFECGAKQVTAGSIAVKEKEIVAAWFEKYGPEQIILGADVINEHIAISGWAEESEVNIFDFLSEYREKGASYVICTDVSKDGMLEGPSFELYRKVMGEVQDIKLIASGGVKEIADIEELNSEGLYGVIIGKAIYEGNIKLTDLSVFLC